jgi:pimeloyl-ACP methyl ester carboxylesterase
MTIGERSDLAAGERRLIKVPGGRVVDVLLAGPQDGLPLVLHNGTPSGLVAWTESVRAAELRGLRTVMPARPGYEGSTPRPGRLVADVAGDVAAVLDALGAETFVTAGWSGGGPHALACSAMLPDRCLAAVTIAGVAPYRAEGLDWMAGMGPENIREFGAALRGADTLAGLLDAQAEGMRAVQGGQVIAELGGLLPDADKAVLNGGFADYLAAALRSSVQGDAGIAGWRDDDLAFAADWGFPLASAGKVAVWQGGQDLMVPAAHGKWLAKHIPGARSRFRRGDGHLSLKLAFDKILDDLLDLAGL